MRHLDNSIDFTVLPAESQHLTSNAKKCLNIFFLYQRQGDVLFGSQKQCDFHELLLDGPKCHSFPAIPNMAN